MNELTALQVDSLQKVVEDEGPILLDKPRQGFLSQIASNLLVLVAGVSPEETGQVLVFEDCEGQRFLVHQNAADAPVAVER